MSSDTHGTEHPPTILCVDDEPGILRAITRVLRTEPLRVLSATSGAEALDLVRQTPFQLIICDYRMPNMNGVQFLKLASVLCPEAFRILLTGYADVGAISEAINDAQTYKILYKPWNDDDLKLTIRAALAHYQQNHENILLQKELAHQNIQLQLLTRQLEAKLTDRTGELAVCSSSLITTQNLLDHLPCAVLGMEDSGLIVLANHKAQIWFGQGQPLMGEWGKNCLPACVLKIFDEASGGTSTRPLPITRELVHGLPLILRGQRMTTPGVDGKPIMAGILIYADRHEAPPKGGGQ